MYGCHEGELKTYRLLFQFSGKADIPTSTSCVFYPESQMLTNEKLIGNDKCQPRILVETNEMF